MGVVMVPEALLEKLEPMLEYVSYVQETHFALYTCISGVGKAF